MMTVPRKSLLAATVVALAVALPACGSEDSDGDTKARGAASGEGGGNSGGGEAKVVATSDDKGKYPTTLAHASLDDPGAIKMKITPDPAQTTHAAWTVACRKGRRAETTADRFTVRRTVTKSMNRPFTNPDSCEVSASAQMVKRGTITVRILEKPIPSS